MIGMDALFYLIFVLIFFAIAWYLIQWLQLPEPFPMIARLVMALVLLVFIFNLLFGGIAVRPLFR
jgi:hypothetical protein